MHQKPSFIVVRYVRAFWVENMKNISFGLLQCFGIITERSITRYQHIQMIYSIHYCVVFMYVKTCIVYMYKHQSYIQYIFYTYKHVQYISYEYMYKNTYTLHSVIYECINIFFGLLQQFGIITETNITRFLGGGGGNLYTNICMDFG